MSEEPKLSGFKVKKVTDLAKVMTNEVDGFLPESDLTIQHEQYIIQYEYQKPDEQKKETVKPGIYSFVNTPFGIGTAKLELRSRTLLTSVVNTTRILNEANTFFNRLDVYEKLGRAKKRGVLLYSAPGYGKCLGIDTPVLMYDGSIKKVQDVILGDKLMGPDSKPRAVLSLARGQEEMFRVTPTKGQAFTCNRSHILSLRNSGDDQLVNISIDDYLKLPQHKQFRLKAWRTEAIDFTAKDQELTIPAYILGCWLGDGTSNKIELTSMDTEIVDEWKGYAEGRGLTIKEYKQVNNSATQYFISCGPSFAGCQKEGRNSILTDFQDLKLIGNKHIPSQYKMGSKEQRLELLAGLLDTDGHLFGNCFEIIQKNQLLAEDIAYISRSLGLAAYVKECKKSSQNGTEGIYYRVIISGNTDIIPTRLPRKQALKRRQVKDVLRTGFTVESLGLGDYYGFEINEDRLFVLGDFTVTHNTAAISQFCSDMMVKDPGTVVLNWPTDQVKSSDVCRFLATFTEFTPECTKLILIIEDIGGGEKDYDRDRSVSSSLLNLLDGVDFVFKLPTFIVATTNHPENLLGALADRPGRFDLMLELRAPKAEERVALLKFIAKRDLTEDEVEAISHEKANAFSIAHLEEIVVRSMLHDKPIAKVIEELAIHGQKFKKGFEPKKAGVGFSASMRNILDDLDD